MEAVRQSVFGSSRDIAQPSFSVDGLQLDTRQRMDGLELLGRISDGAVPLVFFDPQYRSVLDRQEYGNEGERRGRRRSSLPQMSNETIRRFLVEIERVLMPSGHAMLWVDKYLLVMGVHTLLDGTGLQAVDMITWNKDRMGMGYRTRRYSENLVVLQKPKIRAKGVWRLHNIPDVWTERVSNGDANHTHSKPMGLQRELIRAVTNVGDIVVDPAAGGYSVLRATLDVGRHFVGCDILG